MNYKFIAMFGLLGCLVASGKVYATQIDVINDGIHYDEGVLIATEQTEDNDPLIAGSSLSNNDAIVFRDEDDVQARIPVGLGDSEKFVLQGNVILENPVDFSGDTLQINGYLQENSSTDTAGSDFSGVDLELGSYIIPASGESEESTEIPGQLILNNDIKLGNATFNDGVSIHLYKEGESGTIIGVSGTVALSGNNLITGSEGSRLTMHDLGGEVVFDGSVIIDENIDETTIEAGIENNGNLGISNNLISESGITNNGLISIGRNFEGKRVINQANAVFNVDRESIFKDDVENRGDIQLNSTTVFMESVTNDGNASLTTVKDATFAGVVSNSGNATMTLNGDTEFANTGSLSAVDNATITAYGNVIFNDIDTDDYARIITKRDARFDGTVATDGHARIITEGDTVFNGVINTSGNSLIQVKKVADFNEEISNAGNAHLQIDGNARFNNAKTITNQENATIKVNGVAQFSGAIENIDDANIIIDGSANFADTITNSDYSNFTNNGDTIFNENVYNYDNSEMNLNGTSEFRQQLVNDGNAILKTTGTTEISGALTNTANAQIKADGQLSANSLDNSGNIELNNKASFTGDVHNQGKIESSSDINFGGVVTNSSLAQLDVEGNANFAQNVVNSGTLTVGGQALFNDVVSNQGTIVVNGDTFIGNVVNNTSDMQLNNVNFSDNAALYNSGNLSLSNTTLRSSIDNNSTGVISLSENNLLGEDWQSLGNVRFTSNSSLGLGNHKLTLIGNEKNIVFNDGATLKFDINSVGDVQRGGQIVGDVVLNGNTKVIPTFAFGLTEGEYAFVDGTVDASSGAWVGYDDNKLYNVTLKGNTKIGFDKKSNDEIAETVGTKGAQTDVLVAMMDGTADNDNFNHLAGNVTAMLQSNDENQIKKAKQILDAVSPEEMPMVQQTAVEASNQIFDVVGARLANRTPVMMKNWRRGMAAGDDMFESGAAWVQGMGNKAELKDSDDHNGFESTTTGLAMGFEKQVTENARAGLGYAYSQTEIDSDLRDIDATTHTAIAYAEYKRNKMFANVIAAYGWSNFKEDSVAASAKYVVESMGLQAMAGYYGLTTGALRFIPEAGVRYVHVKQHDYDNSIGVKYDNLSTDVVTGIVGARISAIGGNGNGLKIIPEARIALTYDIENSEDKEALVTLPNGSSYIVRGRALDRFGVEVGAGITAEVNDNVDLSVSYEGKFRKDYSDHTGIIKGKYKF